MNSHERSKHDADYGRKLMKSALDGARSGREEFLHGEPLAHFLNNSARTALRPAALGACLGVLSSYPGRGRGSAARCFGYAFLGSVAGFGLAIAWESRRLAASVAWGARQQVHSVRDEHWLENNPIDYA